MAVLKEYVRAMIGKRFTCPDRGPDVMKAVAACVRDGVIYLTVSNDRGEMFEVNVERLAIHCEPATPAEPVKPQRIET